MVEDIKTVLVSHTIKDVKKCINGPPGNADSRDKGIHVELVMETMEEATHTISEIIKGYKVKKSMVQKYILL